MYEGKVEMSKEKAWVFSTGNRNNSVRLEYSKITEEFRQGLLNDKQRKMEEKLGTIIYNKGVTTGKVFIDDELIREWETGSLEHLPNDVIFEVNGKPAVLRSKGRILKKIELYVDGNLII